MRDCGGQDTCEARFRAWLAAPDDRTVVNPCKRCMWILATLFGVTLQRPTLPWLRAALHEAGLPR